MQPGEDEDDEDDGDSDTTLQMGPRELDEERLGIRSVSPADSDAQMAEGARMPDAGGQRGPPHREAARPQRGVALSLPASAGSAVSFAGAGLRGPAAGAGLRGSAAGAGLRGSAAASADADQAASPVGAAAGRSHAARTVEFFLAAGSCRRHDGAGAGLRRRGDTADMVAGVGAGAGRHGRRDRGPGERARGADRHAGEEDHRDRGGAGADSPDAERAEAGERAGLLHRGQARQVDREETKEAKRDDVDEDKIDVGSVSTLYEVDIYSASSDSDTFGERKRFSEGEGAKGAKKAATHAAHFAKDATNADDARMAKDAKDSKADGQFDADINKTLLVHRTEAEDAEVGSETNMELSCISVSREYGPDWKEAKSGTVQTLIDGEISKSLNIDQKQRQTSEPKLHEASRYMYMKVTKTTTRSTTSRESESFSHKQNVGLLRSSEEHLFLGPPPVHLGGPPLEAPRMRQGPGR